MFRSLLKSQFVFFVLGLSLTGAAGCGNENGGDEQHGLTHTSDKNKDDNNSDDNDKSGCKHGTPDSATGKCLKCEDINWTGDYCDRCAPDFSGDDCMVYAKQKFGEFKDYREVFFANTGETKLAGETYKTIKIGKQIWYAENSQHHYFADCINNLNREFDFTPSYGKNWMENYYDF